MLVSLPYSLFMGGVKWNAAKLLQSCPTLCDPIDGSPPGSAVPGILQARTLEWVAISSSSEMEYLLSYQQTKMSHLSVIQASPNVSFWAYHKQQMGELGAAICQTKNSRMSRMSRMSRVHGWAGSDDLPAAEHHVCLLQKWQEKG